MVGKCLLRSVCYEVTSYVYHFANDINVLFFHFCLKFVMLLCIVAHDFYQRKRNNITGWSYGNQLQLDRSIIIFLYGILIFPLLYFEIECAQQNPFKVNGWYKKRYTYQVYLMQSSKNKKYRKVNILIYLYCFQSDDNDDGESPAGNRMIIRILITVPKVFATCTRNYFLYYSVIKQN